MGIAATTQGRVTSMQLARHPAEGRRLLLVNHVAVRDHDGTMAIDKQTRAGLDQLARHFERVTMVGLDGDLLPNDVGVPVDKDHVSVLSLPNGYRWTAYFRQRKAVRAHFTQLLDSHDTVVCGIGSLAGDWPGELARLCRRKHIPHAVWFDRVEPEIAAIEAATSRRRHRVKTWLERPIMRWSHRRHVRGADVGIFQGQDTYAEFAPFSRRPLMVFDSHLDATDVISEVSLAAKVESVQSRPLRIMYAGRAAAMKAPMDWLLALAEFNRRQVEFTATWFGDGPAASDMRVRIRQLGLEQRVQLAGATSHPDVLDAMRNYDVFLHCHVTAESPRCIIEAAANGCAIVGYESKYVAGVLEDGSGSVPLGDWEQLADELERLHHNRDELTRRMQHSAEVGRRYLEAPVYEHRAAAMAAAGSTTDPAKFDPRNTPL
jgi:glycosyltransferase involved in cell wall biosynthesis